MKHLIKIINIKTKEIVRVIETSSHTPRSEADNIVSRMGYDKFTVVIENVSIGA